MTYEPLIPGMYYHIYNRGNNGEDLFIEEKNYYYFMKLLMKYTSSIAELLSYCLLKNHFHLLVKTNENTNNSKISQGFSNFFNAHAKAINKAYNRTGSLFNNRFKRIKIDNEDYLKSLVIYINSNPVHHGFCEEVEKYQDSSYLSLISNSETTLNRKEIIKLFETKDNFKQVINQKQDHIKNLTFE